MPPPEDDIQAKSMAAQIKQWISQGKPKPGEEPKNNQSEKTKKKRSFFGRFKR